MAGVLSNAGRSGCQCQKEPLFGSESLFWLKNLRHPKASHSEREGREQEWSAHEFLKVQLSRNV